MDQQNASAQRLLPAAMLKRWLQVCRVKITFGLFPMNRFVTTTWRKNSVKCLRKLESRFYWESALVRELPNPHRYAYYVNLNVMSTLMIDTIRIYMYIFAKLGHYAWRDISLEPFLWSGSPFLQDPLFPWLWAYICPPSTNASLVNALAQSKKCKFLRSPDVWACLWSRLQRWKAHPISSLTADSKSPDLGEGRAQVWQCGKLCFVGTEVMAHVCVCSRLWCYERAPRPRCSCCQHLGHRKEGVYSLPPYMWRSGPINISNRWRCIFLKFGEGRLLARGGVGFDKIPFCFEMIHRWSGLLLFDNHISLPARRTPHNCAWYNRTKSASLENEFLFFKCVCICFPKTSIIN